MNIMNLIHFRALRNLTAKQLSELSGIPYSVIYNIEGRRSEPSVEQMEILAKSLSISPMWLIDSPCVQTEEQALNLVKKISDYTNGIHTESNGTLTLKSPHNEIIFEINSLSGEVDAGKKSVDDFLDWILNRSSYSLQKSVKKTEEILKENILRFAKENQYSDFTMGLALGYDEFNAADRFTLYKLGEVNLTKKNIASFLSKFQLSYSELSDGFSIRNKETLEHAMLALYHSQIGRFRTSNKGYIKFDNDSLRARITNEFKASFSKSEQIP